MGQALSPGAFACQPIFSLLLTRAAPIGAKLGQFGPVKSDHFRTARLSEHW
ncbi:hypothetical protein SBA4_6970008 [Candidatus Sulfopaludibacter sp. SbA4]|nr:hypothetical protein SBA4_6970008 [Candidatus Sulfopaludibacter sp. SbA4]